MSCNREGCRGEERKLVAKFVTVACRDERAFKLLT